MLDDAHFHDWFTGAEDALVRYACLCCGDRHQAEELVADAVARMWPAWRGSRIVNPDGYCRRIIANRLTDRRRRAAVKRRVDDRLRHRGVATGDPSEASADQLTLWPLVLALPPKERAVIVLRYFEARSEADIAELLDISPGTVKSRASRVSPSSVPTPGGAPWITSNPACPTSCPQLVPESRPATGWLAPYARSSAADSRWPHSPRPSPSCSSCSAPSGS